MQVPEVCSYEADVTVTLNVTDMVDGQYIVLGPTNQLMFEVSNSTSNLSVSCDSTYNVSLTVKNQVNERINIFTIYGNVCTNLPSAWCNCMQFNHLD